MQRLVSVGSAALCRTVSRMSVSAGVAGSFVQDIEARAIGAHHRRSSMCRNTRGWPSAASPPSQATCVVHMDDLGRCRLRCRPSCCSHPLWRERRRMIAMRPMLSTAACLGHVAGTIVLTRLLIFAAAAERLCRRIWCRRARRSRHRRGRRPKPLCMPDGTRLPYRAWAGRRQVPWAVVLALHGMNDSRDAWEFPRLSLPRRGSRCSRPTSAGSATPQRGLLAGHAGTGGRRAPRWRGCCTSAIRTRR